METQKYAAEAIGTFWSTFTGCGSAVIAAGFPQVGIGLVGVSLAFGLRSSPWPMRSVTCPAAISIWPSPSVSLPADVFPLARSCPM